MNVSLSFGSIRDINDLLQKLEEEPNRISELVQSKLSDDAWRSSHQDLALRLLNLKPIPGKGLPIENLRNALLEGKLK